MKSILKIAAIICAIFGIFNLCLLFIQKTRIDFHDTAEYINMSESYSKTNYVLVRKKNSIRNFPFVFGERLYLYDIGKDRGYLISNYVRPFYTYGDMLAVHNNKVFYNVSGEGPGIELYSKELQDIGMGQKILDQAGLYTVSSNDIYYLKNQETTYKEEQNFLYKKNLKNGKTKTVLKENLSNVLRFDNGFIYSWNRISKELLEINEKNKTIVRCTAKEEPLWIGYVDPQHFLSIDEANIVLYNKKTKHKKYLVKNIKKEEELLNRKAKIEKDYLYYNNENLDFYRLNVYTGDKQKIISLSENDAVKEYIQYSEYYADVNYCNDYVVIDLNYVSNKKLNLMNRRLLVFDYKGKLVKNKKLKALM